MGSGFFESGESGVLFNIVRRVQAAAHLTESAKIDVILNPTNCQGIAEQAESLKAGSGTSWIFSPRAAPTHRSGYMLSSCFRRGASGTARGHGAISDRATLANTECSVAASQGGNLEAGVVFEPQDLVWKANDPRSVENHLPIGGLEVKPCKLKHGEDFEHPDPGVDAPAVGYLVWRDRYLYLPEAAPPDMQISIIGPGGEKTCIPCLWNPPPPAVTLADCLAQVPVLADGGFVLPSSPDPMRNRGCARGPASFPRGIACRFRPPWRFGGMGDRGYGRARHRLWRYPVRRIMRLVVGFCDRQPSIKRQDWARWTNSCEELLLALTTLNLASSKKFGCVWRRSLRRLASARIPSGLAGAER